MRIPCQTTNITTTKIHLRRALILTFISPWTVLETSQLIVAAHLCLDLCKALRIILEILRSASSDTLPLLRPLEDLLLDLKLLLLRSFNNDADLVLSTATVVVGDLTPTSPVSSS